MLIGKLAGSPLTAIAMAQKMERWPTSFSYKLALKKTLSTTARSVVNYWCIRFKNCFKTLQSIPKLTFSHFISSKAYIPSPSG